MNFELRFFVGKLSNFLLRLCCIFSLSYISLAAGNMEPIARAFDVTHYTVRITPDIGAKTLSGTVSITYVMRTKSDSNKVNVDGSILQFDAGDLQIDAVMKNGLPLGFEKRGRQIFDQYRMDSILA